jgi:hypothetical protein
MDKLVNGPVNAYRLEGNIFGINKTIFIYMDVHFDVWKETKCEGNVTYDFTTYLYNELIKSKDKDIDFFLEIFDIDIKSYKTIKHTKYRYVDEIRKFFSKNIIIDKNKTIGTTIKNNIRFHYIDIRNYLDKFIFNKIKIISQHIMNNTYNDMDILLEEVQNEFILIKNIFDDLLKNKKVTVINKYYTNFVYMINKLLHKYDHAEVKEIITYYLNYVNKEINNIINMIDKFILVIKNKKKKQLSKLNDKLFIRVLVFFSMFVDLYFIRRILDKDYITNILSYTGIAHSANIIYILVHYFNFNITHISDSKQNKNISDIVNSIKKLKLKPFADKKKLTNIIYQDNSKNLIQCSDMTHFPDI